MSGILWIIIVGFVAGIIARILSPGPNNPSGFILTTILGIAGAFLATIRADPSVPQPYQFLGRMVTQAPDRKQQILQVLEAWYRQSPGQPDRQLLLAKTLAVNDGDPQRIESLLRQSLRQRDGEWEAHYELGKLLASQQKWPEAEVELQRAISLNGNEAMPHYHLARVYQRLGKAPEAAAERQRHAELEARSPKQ